MIRSNIASGEWNGTPSYLNEKRYAEEMRESLTVVTKIVRDCRETSQYEVFRAALLALLHANL